MQICKIGNKARAANACGKDPGQVHLCAVFYLETWDRSGEDCKPQEGNQCHETITYDV